MQMPSALLSVFRAGHRPAAARIPNPGIAVLLLASLILQGCAAMVVGAVVGTAATVAVEAAKVPVKATGAVVDAVTDDENDEEKD